MATQIELERCGAEHRGVLDALFQLYTHDFSEYWVGQARGELDASGHFERYPGLDRYWTEAGREAFLIRAGAALAGFVLVSPESNSGDPIDHDMAEFFVVRKHRRTGVGMAAACRVIAERPGSWEIAIARANTPALAFWERVAAATTTDWHARDSRTERWNGTILRLQVSSAG